MNILLILQAADWLEQNNEIIVNQTSGKIFGSLDSYRGGKVSVEESRSTLKSIIGYIIDFLRKNHKSDNGNNININDFVTFQNGIASKRVVYEVKLEDLLEGLGIFREEIWAFIASKLRNTQLESSEFIELEKRINTIFLLMVNRMANIYNKAMADIIGIQASDLMKWEEVVKSASNIELKIPCKSEFAAIVRLQAEAIGRRLKYDEEEIQDIKVAVGEACDNAIEHGVSEKGIDVHYHLSIEEMLVEVIDYGKGFDPSDKGALPDFLSERGRGIFLMKSLVDRVEIYSKQGEGTMIILAKKRVFKENFKNIQNLLPAI